jgi:hypothetical protein
MTDTEFENLVETTLNMGKLGFYREDFFQEFNDRYTRGELGDVLCETKTRGLYSVPDMRDQEKGTYYQYDDPETSGTA